MRPIAVRGLPDAAGVRLTTDGGTIDVVALPLLRRAVLVVGTGAGPGEAVRLAGAVHARATELGLLPEPGGSDPAVVVAMVSAAAAGVVALALMAVRRRRRRGRPRALLG